MPGKPAEIFTFPPNASTDAAQHARNKCLCRFRGEGQECNQEEHRGERAWLELENYPMLQEKYGREKIPFGLCTIWSMQRHLTTPWIVCPNRLFYAGAHSTTVESAIYQAWGLAPGDKVGLWVEVKITRSRQAKKFNFTFDYVFRKLIKENPLTFGEVPYLVEIMTASTSGGEVEKTFVNGLLENDLLTGTSINYRQVVARMMSQFIAKAQAASEWGGKAVWIVQDLLWRYVEVTTGFSRDEFYDDPKGNVVVLIRRLETEGYEAANPNLDRYNLRLEQIIRGWDRFERSKGENYVGRDFVSMLNAPFVPERDVILNATNKAPVAILTCA